MVAANAHKIGMPNEAVLECLDLWVTLDVLEYNEDRSQSKFIAPNMYESTAASIHQEGVGPSYGNYLEQLVCTHTGLRSVLSIAVHAHWPLQRMHARLWSVLFIAVYAQLPLQVIRDEVVRSVFVK